MSPFLSSLPPRPHCDAAAPRLKNHSCDVQNLQLPNPLSTQAGDEVPRLIAVWGQAGPRSGPKSRGLVFSHVGQPCVQTVWCGWHAPSHGVAGMPHHISGGHQSVGLPRRAHDPRAAGEHLPGDVAEFLLSQARVGVRRQEGAGPAVPCRRIRIALARVPLPVARWVPEDHTEGGLKAPREGPSLLCAAAGEERHEAAVGILCVHFAKARSGCNEDSLRPDISRCWQLVADGGDQPEPFVVTANAVCGQHVRVRRREY
mmetsp:Transcript_63562/g.201000  ORF Transcript_63562/g.201000 Transcript_63562/m.201000 type:complete len:258 (-) Transcript_63562:781-1554(-)